MPMESKTANVTPVRLDLLNEKGEVIHTSEFVKEKIVLGRILSADLRIDDPRVSRIHALLEVRGGSVLVTDLASSHGTYVNGESVVERAVKPGDIIRLGNIELRLERGSGKTTNSQPTFEGRPVTDGDETSVEIDRAAIDNSDRRGASPDRRKKDAFPEEQRLEDRRQGDRRVEQRSGSDRRQTPSEGPNVDGMVAQERREGSDRREALDYERRVGERRKNDRRVFDITSLERRIEDRRTRRNEDDSIADIYEKAFETPEHARELEVTILWGDHILDVSNYYKPMTLNVGESPKNDYIIPSEGIPEEFPLVTIEDDGTAYLAFTNDMRGTIRAREKIYSPADLAKEKFVKRGDGEWSVVGMKQDDFAKLSIGNINFFVLYVKPAPRIKRAPLFEQDALLMRTMIGSALLLGLFLLAGMFSKPPKPVTIESMPESMRTIIIKKKPTIPKEKKDAGSKAGEGGPPKGEKKEPPKEAKKEAAPKAAPKQQTQRERKVVDAQKAKSVGLLKAFSNTNPALTALSDSNDLSAFGKAVGQQRGAGIEAVGGLRGFKGVEGGGGGHTIGIDGPSTKGLGRGYGGGGIGEGLGGPGRLGIKGEHAVSIVSENVQVLSGLPKDVINAVVQRHRAEIRACYDAALQRNPSLRGKIVISFTIKPTGVVSYAGVKESTINDSGLENCILARVKSWGFPKPEAPVETEVSAYPFYLNPAN